MKKRVMVGCAVTLLVLASVLLAEAEPEQPQISVRFETPRDFGYHIGDLIPLTLLIETGTGVVIDLESLPHRGEAIGLFEVRNVRIDHSGTLSGSAYRIQFTLQSFVPATAALAAVFPPLELRFALPEDRLADGEYVYRAVTLPPHLFFLSPTAIGPVALRSLKGSVIPQTGWFFWGALGLGAVFLATGLGRLAWGVARWWKQRSVQERSRAARRAMRTLKVLRERYVACEETTPYLFSKASGVLRRFLTEECAIPARVETTHQIGERFRGHPLESELTEVLERCNQVIYDGDRPTPSERDGILREVTTLIGRLEQVGCPIHGGNGASR
jgi:hypothetical protein